MFQSIDIPKTEKSNEKTTIEPEIDSQACCRSSTVRSIWYILSFTLLFIADILVLFALFTVHWKKTASPLIQENVVYFTEGLFLLCRQVDTPWLDQTDVYCISANNETNRWIIAVQFFYTLGSLLETLAFIFAFIGLFKDFKKTKQAVPSLLMWMLIVASLFLLIGISVYGNYGISDYTYFEPDYSVIIASVGLGINAICVLLFILDLIKSRSTTDRV